MKSRVGEEYVLNSGRVVSVVEYNNYTDVVFQFKDNGNCARGNLGNVKSGTLKDRFAPSVCGVGVVGNLPTKMEGKHLNYYSHWSSMLKRCYSASVHKIRPTCIGNTVCEEWLYLENFKPWFDKNWVEGQALDKDILVMGNTCYSPATCRFVPPGINSLLTNSQPLLGVSGLVGVFYDPRDSKYYPRCNLLNGRVTGRGYYIKKEAFNQYKSIKEAAVRTTIESFYKSGELDEDIYKTLLTFEVTEAGYKWENLHYDRP